MSLVILITLSDEELFKLGHEGNQDAITVLYNRFLTMRKGLARLINPNAYTTLDDYHILDALNDAFSRAYLQFRPEESKFRTFFESIYQNSLYDQMRLVKKENAFNPYSFDMSFNGDDDDKTCLHDIVPSGEVSDDPHLFMNYLETLESLDSLPPSLPPESVEVARMVLIEGYTRDECAAKLKLSHSRVAYLLRKFHLWARKVLGPHK